jgi:hypothetical protein
LEARLERASQKAIVGKSSSHALMHTRYFRWRQACLQARLNTAKDQAEPKQLPNTTNSKKTHLCKQHKEKHFLTQTTHQQPNTFFTKKLALDERFPISKK